MFLYNDSRTKPTFPIAGLLMLILVNPALTSPPKQLTFDGKKKLSPIFTHSGKHLVFSTHSLPNRVTLEQLVLATGKRTRLLPNETAHQWDVTFSNDGRYWCYARSASSPQLQLVIRDTHENTEAIFATPEPRGTVRHPTFSPDNTHIVFGLSGPGGHQIASVNLQGQKLRKLTAAPGINTGPEYSFDGDKLVFTSSRTGNFEIYSMLADGNKLQMITNNPAMDLHPSWSPDGKWIAFTTLRDGNYEVYLMNEQGTNLVNVTNHHERDQFSAWHPNGQHLVTVSERKGRFDLYLHDLHSLTNMDALRNVDK